MKGKAFTSMRWRSRLSRAITPHLSFGSPLEGLTTLGIGGPAECLARPVTLSELKAILSFSLEEGVPAWLLGGGSNVLVPDEGLPGVTIQTGSLNGISWEDKGEEIFIKTESGTLLASILALAIRKGWEGLEFAAGIPGTVGGALHGNAGVEGISLGDLVHSVSLVDNRGMLIEKARKDISFAYRFSDLHTGNRAIASARLMLKRSDPEKVASRVRYFLNRRKNQPKGVKTAGCVFKNPDGQSAGKLLDEAGCKGMRVGDAVISMKHANFIENAGKAKASDIGSLISECRDRVFHRTGITLETEIRILGDDL